MSQLEDVAGVPISDPVYRFPWSTLAAIVEGRSAIDENGLRIGTRSDAGDFLLVYGLNVDDPLDQLELKAIAEQSERFILDFLLPFGDLSAIPDTLPRNLVDLLLLASTPDHALRDWACSFLRVAHAVAHARYAQDLDLLNAARSQIFERFSAHLKIGSSRVLISDGEMTIPLVRCDFKAEKPWESLVLKLLHKVDNVAQEVYDHLGVRFVTLDKAYALLLLKYLRANNLFSYPNVKPSRSVNTLLDLEDFRTRFDGLEEAYHQGEISFKEFTTGVHRLGQSPDRSNERNPHSASAYQTMQFTARSLVRVVRGGIVTRAFVPFEIQIMDEPAYEASQAGEAAHQTYRARQRDVVRKRVFPWSLA